RPGTVGALQQAVDFLRERDLLPGGMDRARLGSADAKATMSNAAIVWAGDADRAAFTRMLMADLAGLEKCSESQLSTGPLGIVLGQVAPSWVDRLEPTPAVLATTLEQERAICSA